MAKDVLADAAVKAILFNLPVDGFGEEERLQAWAHIWGNAATIAVMRHVLAAVDGLRVAEPDSVAGEAYLLALADVRESIAALRQEGS